MGFYQYAPTNIRLATVSKVNGRSIHTATISYCPHTDRFVVFLYIYQTPANKPPQQRTKLVGNDYPSALDATCAALQAVPAGELSILSSEE